MLRASTLHRCPPPPVHARRLAYAAATFVQLVAVVYFLVCVPETHVNAPARLWGRRKAASNAVPSEPASTSTTPAGRSGDVSIKVGPVALRSQHVCGHPGRCFVHGCSCSLSPVRYPRIGGTGTQESMFLLSRPSFVLWCVVVPVGYMAALL